MGFLGSGKTTLLNWILTSNEHRMRIAIIENEYGEVGIDQALIQRTGDQVQADEELIEMNNGCICCTVRGDLIDILNKLHNKSRRRGKAGRIEHVLIETTGLADPGPVAQTFFVDDSVQAKYRLEGIVTVVDALHIAAALSNSREAQGIADVILLNKTDLVPDGRALDALEARVRSINAAANIHRTTNSRMDPARLLTIGGFNASRALQVDPTFFQPEQAFEYAAAYELQQPGRYRLHLEEGPDASMKLGLLPALGTQSSSGSLSAPMDISAPQEQPAPVTVSSLVTANVPRVLNEQSHAAMVLFTKNRALKTKSHVMAPGSVLPSLAGESGAFVQLTLKDGSSNDFTLDVLTPGTWLLYSEHQPVEYNSPEGWQIFRDPEPESGKPPALVLPVATHSFKPTHEHDLSVSSVGIEIAEPLSERKLNAWLGRLLREQGTDLYRSKGVLWLDGWTHRYVFHAVHMLWSGKEDTLWKTGERRLSQMIFIGKNLDRQALTNGFMDCVQRI